MAKVVSNTPAFTGTKSGITIYKMHGRYYVRAKSSLSSKRVKQSPVFRRTMENAGRLAQASRIASFVYRAIPEDERQHALYRTITGHALRLLKEGKDREEVRALLMKAYITPPVILCVTLTHESGVLHSLTPILQHAECFASFIPSAVMLSADCDVLLE